MGQAKAKKAAAAVDRSWGWRPSDDLPKDLIARAVRTPMQGANIVVPNTLAGTCVYQAEIGRRILQDRFDIVAVMFVGDFMRPVGGGLQHTYTREDGTISVETGACHAWLFSQTLGEYIDFAAWETPVQMERNGMPWSGPRPDYLWDTPERLGRQGYIAKVSKEASSEVARNLRAGRDADFLKLYLLDALNILDRGGGARPSDTRESCPAGAPPSCRSPQERTKMPSGHDPDRDSETTEPKPEAEASEPLIRTPHTGPLPGIPRGFDYDAALKHLIPPWSDNVEVSKMLGLLNSSRIAGIPGLERPAEIPGLNFVGMSKILEAARPDGTWLIDTILRSVDTAIAAPHAKADDVETLKDYRRELTEFCAMLDDKNRARGPDAVKQYFLAALEIGFLLGAVSGETGAVPEIIKRRQSDAGKKSVQVRHTASEGWKQYAVTRAIDIKARHPRMSGKAIAENIVRSWNYEGQAAPRAPTVRIAIAPSIKREVCK